MAINQRIRSVRQKDSQLYICKFKDKKAAFNEVCLSCSKNICCFTEYLFSNYLATVKRVPTQVSADFFPGKGARTYFLPKKHTIFLKKPKNILFFAGFWRFLQASFANIFVTFFNFRQVANVARETKKVAHPVLHETRVLNASQSKKYRIYSRISREILDNFRSIFFQFDLYPGHKKQRPISSEIDFVQVLQPTSEN